MVDLRGSPAFLANSSYMRGRQRSQAIIGLAVAGTAIVIGGLIYFTTFNPSQPSNKSSKKTGRRSHALVVDEIGAVDVPSLVAQDDSLVVVGLRGIVFPTDIQNCPRVIETETDDGWVHIVKHLQADITTVPATAAHVHLASLQRMLRNIEIT